MSGEWQPIDTAPKDGTAIDLFDKWGGRWTGAHWTPPSDIISAHWTRFSHGRGRVPVFHRREPREFTHWMPIPKPPAKTAKRAKSLAP